MASAAPRGPPGREEHENIEEQRYIWYDCDPGCDDAVALVLAVAAPEMRLARAAQNKTTPPQLLGVSTVTGNVDLAKVTVNARRMLYLSTGAMDSIPVYPGAGRPLLRELRYAEHVHGETGLDGTDVLGKIALPPSSSDDRPHAVEAMRDAILGTPKHSTWLVCTGPLTNASLLFSTYGDLVCGHLAGLCFMGGAVGVGNLNSAVEFNMAADPEAAKIVLEVYLYAPKIRETVMVPLDLTTQVLAGKEFVQKIETACGTEKALPRTVAQLLTKAGQSYASARRDIVVNEKYGDRYPLHDPCAIFYVLRPELFRTDPCRVRVEAASELCAGQTVVVDFLAKEIAERETAGGEKGKLEIQIAFQMNLDLFWEAVLEAIVIGSKKGAVVLE
eukprot:CAMPEP_0178985812 /NCGR_PEP_ID=MMETSP0795-20121207/2355_1 /TAXON_ID=88552 /ORGANISM="Amoebophrya sp., Strain Ameob2" /LENGTH=387 /DNA_ID=CAMNT_0020676801 /DNA_START=196 /DNA_END=1359 /DNA_ORIENTATION=-